MSTRDDYDIDQWKSISTAPVALGLSILFAETREVGVEACLVIVRRAIARSPSKAGPELVRVLVENWTTEDGRVDGPRPSDQYRDTPNALITIVQSAILAVESRSPKEVEPFKTWLASIAARILHPANVAAVSSTHACSISAAERRTTDQL